jgi:hypothetical protein
MVRRVEKTLPLEVRVHEQEEKEEDETVIFFRVLLSF